MVGIHTPGTEISQIKKLLGLKDWDSYVPRVVTGISWGFWVMAQWP